MTEMEKKGTKIPKWPNLSSLELKAKFIRQFEFSENLDHVYGLALQQLLPYKSSYSHSLMMGASNLAILILSTCIFHFWHLLSYSP